MNTPPRRLATSLGLTAVLTVIGAVITIDRVPGTRRAPCAADVAEGRRKVLEMLRETVKVAIDARDDGAAAAVADGLQRLGRMWDRGRTAGWGKGWAHDRRRP